MDETSATVPWPQTLDGDDDEDDNDDDYYDDDYDDNDGWENDTSVELT